MLNDLVAQLLDHLAQVGYILDNWYEAHYQDDNADFDRAEIDKLFELVTLIEQELA